MAQIQPLDTNVKADTTVLGRLYQFAPIEDIRTAIKALQFEVELYEKRQAIAQAAKDLSAQRTAEVAIEIERIETEFRKTTPKDV